ncbi:hypothetical protein GCM10025767_01610 [Thalassotalea piscium]
MNIIKKSSLAVLLSIFALSSVVSNLAKAESNPFESQGVIVSVDQEQKDKCGEGKCGEAKMKAHKGKCGEAKMKEMKGKCGEGKCGEAKMKAHKGKCGEAKMKEMKGKCGEAKEKSKKCGG